MPETVTVEKVDASTPVSTVTTDGAVSTPAPEVPAGSVVADQPKQASNFRVYDKDKQEFVELSGDVGDERVEKPKEEAKTEEPAKVEEPAKLLAGKFKTETELEKAYLNLEKDYHAKNQERGKEEKAKVEEGAKPLADEAKQAARKVDYASLLLEDPEKFESTIFERLDQRAATHAQTAKMREDWEKVNPDLKGMEHLVRTELQEILASQPDKAKGDLSVLLNEATGNLRTRFAGMVAQAKKEALTVRTTVQPLGVTSVTRQEERNPADKGGASSDPVADEIAARKGNLSRVTGRVPAR